MLNKIRIAKDYIAHGLKAKIRNKANSLFVSQLADEVIYDQSPKKAYDDNELLRKQLLANEQVITVIDLGAGSHVNNNRQKKISDIARHSLKPPKLAQLLYRLALRFKPLNIIELGTCLGTTTMYLKQAAPNAEIYTLEGCPEVSDVAKTIFEKTGTTNIHLVTGNFDNTLPGIIESLDRIDFVFIDGNHQKEATLKYFEWCLPRVHENTLLVFDDIYWSEGMKQAWEQIKAHPKVSVSIDLFWMGLVFFKTDQKKGDFLLKYKAYN